MRTVQVPCKVGSLLNQLEMLPTGQAFVGKISANYMYVTGCDLAAL